MGERRRGGQTKQSHHTLGVIPETMESLAEFKPEGELFRYVFQKVALVASWR